MIIFIIIRITEDQHLKLAQKVPVVVDEFVNTRGSLEELYVLVSDLVLPSINMQDNTCKAFVCLHCIVSDQIECHLKDQDDHERAERFCIRLSALKSPSHPSEQAFQQKISQTKSMLNNYICLGVW